MFDPEILTRPGTVLLDSARPDDENRKSWCFEAPRRVLRAATLEDVPELLDALTDATAHGEYVAGVLSYEAGYAFVDLEPEQTADRPLGWFGVYDSPQRLDPADVEAGLHKLDASSEVDNIRLGVSESQYTDAVETIREHIRRGDVYQINYTSPLHFRFSGDARALYRRLRHRQRVPYAAFLNLGDTRVLSVSPELFFRRTGQRVTTRPMKGTIRRGRTLQEDRKLQEQLVSDPKNRAENLMIVDLLRNDLSVCCQTGSVTVPALYTIEPYETVNQMTSTVQGRLRPDADLGGLFRALFPCGSVTGAPKRRAMRLIRQLEPGPRGVYCGAIGMAGPDETAVFNVPIRTVVLEGEEGRMGVGSGIVWDSEPETEYEECRLKGAFLTADAEEQDDPSESDFSLIETVRLEDGRISLLDRHMQRLSQSAQYFSFPIDVSQVRRRIEAALEDQDAEAVLRVRLTLDRQGDLTVATSPLEEHAEEPWRLLVSSERVDRTDPLVYHKTTRRSTYNRALAEARDAGCDEAILRNEDGEVTEGTFTNLFVRQGEALYTPPVECGLLSGVYRAHVLETRPEVSERVLHLDDIAAADALYCCNALRGWRRATLVDRDDASGADDS